MQSAAGEFSRLATMPANVKLKADGSFLTIVDEGINSFLFRTLTMIDPSIGWLSEEVTSGDHTVKKELTWVVDPLDGTKEFVRGLPEYAISIGLLHKGQIIAGGVVNPANGIGAATGTDGKFIQWPAGNKPISSTDIRHAAISVSRTEIEDGTILPAGSGLQGIRPVGSVAYKLMRVACSIDDLSFSLQPKSLWDICGGIALLNASGKKFYRLDGKGNLFDTENTRIKMGYIAGPKHLVEEIKPLLLSGRLGDHNKKPG